MKSFRWLPIAAAALAVVFAASRPIPAHAQRGAAVGARAPAFAGGARAAGVRMNAGAYGGAWGAAGHHGGYGYAPGYGYHGGYRYYPIGYRPGSYYPHYGHYHYGYHGHGYGSGYGYGYYPIGVPYYPAYAYPYYGPHVALSLIGPGYFYTPNFARPSFIFDVGFTLGSVMAPAPLDGFGYYDPYCNQSYDSLDGYYEHCEDAHHPAAIEVIDEQKHQPVAIAGYHDGQWLVDDAH
jgi:hypothetical protein